MYRSTTAPVRSSPAQASFQPQECNHPQAIKLTAREKEVLQWSAIGKSSWEIAQIVDCTEAGVNYHFCNIRRKFGVRSRWIAMVMALEQGLIQTP
ncbi:LuxR family quorum-sensing transcriptional regulator LasR [Pseudomonas lini]|jgi:LuxR family quorum-sensing transcriptional regulator LasR|uniref:LuxR family transcriptional regulator n=1 Tax=Pseudomonas lini TaxID=163011 RepID=UPI002789BACA|nr:LuxR family transcriptional regulator [Pseudomonas lini]MDQ0127097.1 LuxR family quorum-sensing transcriptional regulator LasR [Pseudomonas lini]